MTVSNIPAAAAAAGIAKILQLSSTHAKEGRQAVKTVYHSTNHTSRATLLQLSWAGRRVGSSSLRPSATVVLCFPSPNANRPYIFSIRNKTVGCSSATTCAGILEQSIGARNRVGIMLSYRPARLHRLTESIPWNRFLGFLKV